MMNVPSWPLSASIGLYLQVIGPIGCRKWPLCYRGSTFVLRGIPICARYKTTWTDQSPQLTATNHRKPERDYKDTGSIYEVHAGRRSFHDHFSWSGPRPFKNGGRSEATVTFPAAFKGSTCLREESCCLGVASALRNPGRSDETSSGARS